MNFLVFDETGKITQSNKVFAPDGYGDVLRERNLQFIEADSPTPLSLDDWYVSHQVLTARPDLPYMLSKSQIKADNIDVAVITGLPRPCRVTVIATGGVKLADNEEVTEGYVEISSVAPAVYDIMIEAFPYRPKKLQVVAS